MHHRIFKLNKYAIFVFLYLTLFPVISSAGTWQTIEVKSVQVLPGGDLNIRSGILYGECGNNVTGDASIKPFLVKAGSYGVTTTAVKEMLSLVTTALVAGKNLNISYYLTDSCLVDSITLIK